MKRFLTSALITLLVTLAMIMLFAKRPLAADVSPVRSADIALTGALEKGDKAALGKLLDTDLLWVDATGNRLNRREVLAAIPKLLIAQPSAEPRHFDYGQVATFQDDTDKLHSLRVWVKRPEGWRLLVYHEVRSLDAPPTITPGAGKVCTNPCKTVEYTPKNDTEMAVISAYKALESSAVAKDANAWDAHVAAEFIAVSSNSDKLLDKATRLAEMRRANMAGLSPTPLVSARLFTFGDAAVMLSRHVPDRGKPLQITRVWVRRNGSWVESLSYQTSIERDILGNIQR